MNRASSASRIEFAAAPTAGTCAGRTRRRRRPPPARHRRRLAAGARPRGRAAPPRTAIRGRRDPRHRVEEAPAIRPRTCCLARVRIAARVVDLPLPTEPVTRIESVLVTREQFEMLRQSQFVHRPHLRVNDTKNDVHPETLTNHAGAKATVLIGGIREIHVTAFVQLQLLRSRYKLSARATVSSLASRGASGQIGCRMPCKRQRGGAFTPR